MVLTRHPSPMKLRFMGPLPKHAWGGLVQGRHFKNLFNVAMPYAWLFSG
jgi:hypothetical protein